MHKETSIEKCRCTSYTSVACASSSGKGRGALDIARATAPGAPPHPASRETRARSSDSSADAVNALPYETGRYIPKSGTCVSLSAGQHRQLPYPHPFLCSHKMHEDICVWSRGAVEIQGEAGVEEGGKKWQALPSRIACLPRGPHSCPSHPPPPGLSLLDHWRGALSSFSVLVLTFTFRRTPFRDWSLVLLPLDLCSVFTVITTIAIITIYLLALSRLVEHERRIRHTADAHVGAAKRG